VSGDRTPLLNGLLYGSASGVFGGTFWGLILSLPPDEALIAPRWIVVGGGIGFCFLAGFLVGVFSRQRFTGDKDELQGRGHSLVAKTLAAVGWFFYRLLVGYFIGFIATVVFCLIGIAPWFVGLFLFVDPSKKLLDRPEAQIVVGAITAGVYSGFSGGLFGALLVSRRSVAVRSTLGWRAVRGSFLGFLFGILFGGALGWLPAEEKNTIIHFAASVPIGILAGILGGLWTDIRSIPDGRND
jgi:hypothetical protein